MNKKIFVLALLLLLLPSFTFAKSLSIDDYSIDYTLNKNGIINISEELEYTLDGCYRELFLQRPSSLEILNAKGSCEDKSCDFRHDTKNTPTGDQELVLKGDYCNESVSVKFSYDVVNVINRLQDGNFQFFYKIYGEGTDYDTNLSLSLTVPGDFKEADYFLHSKEHNLEITNNKMFFSKNVIAKEIIEINLLMPKEWFETSEYIKNDSLTTLQVKALENNWETDYDKYMSSITPLSTFFKLFTYFLIILVPLFSLFFIWRRYSKEHSREEINFFEEYYRELPYKDQDPLHANYFLNEKFSSNWFSSAIMYLTWKEIYSLEKEGQNYFLQRTDKKMYLPSYVEKIDLFLQKHFQQNRFNIREIQIKLNGTISFKKDFLNQIKDSNNFKQDFLKLNKEIISDGNQFFKDKRYYDLSGKKIAGIFGLIFFPISFVFMFFVIKKIPLVFIVYILVVIVYLVLINSSLFGKFTKEGRTINLKWKAFKNYISDFSEVKNHPPKHVILWEEYLVYATAFGIAKKVSRNLRIILPEDSNNNSRLAVYSSFILSNSFTSLNSLSQSANSSGSGGGFGGGLGGGGAGGR